MRGIVVFDVGFDEEIISLLRAISMEGAAVGHFVCCLVYGFDAGWWQRACDIAYSQADEVLFGMCGPEGVYFLGYL